MMYKILVLTLMILNLFNFNYVYANTKDILVLYDEAYNQDTKYNSIEVIKEQLLNYSENIDTIEIDSYKKDTVNKYDYIFVINAENIIKYTDLIKDLIYTNRNIYWIGNGIQNLIDLTEKYSIKYLNKDSLISKVKNDKRTKYIDDNRVYNIVQVNNNKDNIIATMTDGYNEYPYIVKDKNLFYTVDFNIKDNEIFLDSLDNFIGEKKPIKPSSKPKPQKENTEKIPNEQILFEQRMKTINKVVVIFITAIIGVFTIVYFKFRKINKNKFKIESDKK